MVGSFKLVLYKRKNPMSYAELLACGLGLMPLHLPLSKYRFGFQGTKKDGQKAVEATDMRQR